MRINRSLNPKPVVRMVILSGAMSFSTMRTEAGLTVDEVATEFGVSLDLARQWEAGTARPPEHVRRVLHTIGRFSGGSRKLRTQQVTPDEPVRACKQHLHCRNRAANSGRGTMHTGLRPKTA